MADRENTQALYAFITANKDVMSVRHTDARERLVKALQNASLTQAQLQEAWRTYLQPFQDRDEDFAQSTERSMRFRLLYRLDMVLVYGDAGELLRHSYRDELNDFMTSLEWESNLLKDLCNKLYPLLREEHRRLLSD